MDELEFTFTKSTSPGSETIVRKKESELTQNEKEILYGQLVYYFTHNTNDNQAKFIRMILEEVESLVKELTQ